MKSYLDKVEVPCSSLSWNPPVRNYRHRHNHAYYQHNHAHYFPHTHRRYNRRTHQQVLVSRSSGNATRGGLIGGGLAAVISKKDAYLWSIPLGAVLGMRIANTDFSQYLRDYFCYCHVGLECIRMDIQNNSSHIVLY